MLNNIASTRGLFRQDTSSASYKAHREEDGHFTLLRLPHKKYDTVPLIGAPSEEVAQRLLDWFVSHDRLIQRVLELQSADALFAVVMQAIAICTVQTPQELS